MSDITDFVLRGLSGNQINEIELALEKELTKEQTAINMLREKLNYLRERTTRVICFAVTDKLHEAMEPERI